MAAFYEPLLNSPHQNTMCVILRLKHPVDGAVLQSAVEMVRERFPYFYVKAAEKEDDLIPVPNDLPMTVRNTWAPILFNSEASNFHLAAWKYEGHRLAFEIPHAMTDGAGVMPYIKSVMYFYLSETTGKTFDPSGFRLPGDVIPESEIGNPFENIDFDQIKTPFYKKKSFPDFMRLLIGKDNDKRVFYLKLPESQVMQYCRDQDGSPNCLFAVLLARAARRYDPKSDKTITASIAVDQKEMLGNHDNYRLFISDAILHFPKSCSLDDVGRACTIARGQLMLQAQPENILFEVKQRMQMPRQPLPDTALASLCVSYPKTRSFGPLDPYIDEYFIVTTLLKITDILCEVTCINHSFFLAFMQPFSSDELLKCFLEELLYAGIQYEVLRSEPLHVCGMECPVKI